MDQISRNRNLMAGVILACLLLALIGIGIAIVRMGVTNELVMRTIHQNTIQEQWRNELGQQVTRASSNYLTTQELLNSQDSSIRALRDDLGKVSKNLETVTYLYATLEQKLRTGVRDTLIVLNDGTMVQSRTFTYSDPWTPSLKGILFGDSLWLTYQSRADWRLTQTWTKRGLFSLGRPRELELEVLSLNPYVTVNRVQQFRIVQPKSKLPAWTTPLATFGLGLILGTVAE